MFLERKDGNKEIYRWVWDLPFRRRDGFSDSAVAGIFKQACPRKYKTCNILNHDEWSAVMSWVEENGTARVLEGLISAA